MKTVTLLKTSLLSALVLGSLSSNAHRACIAPDVTVLSCSTPALTSDMSVSNSKFNFDHVPMHSNGLTIIGSDNCSVTAEYLQSAKFRTVFDYTYEKQST